MMGRMSRVFAMLGVALWLVWSGEAVALAARVALVVGNGDYAAEIGKLKNPTSDAQLMADTLTQPRLRSRAGRPTPTRRR